MANAHSSILATVRLIGADLQRARQLIADGEPDGPGSTCASVQQRIANAMLRLEADRGVWPDDEDACAALEQAIRAQRELSWWNQPSDSHQHISTDEPEYGVKELYDEAMEDLITFFGNEEQVLSGRRRPQRHASGRVQDLPVIATELSELVVGLGPTPWEEGTKDDLDAMRRIEVLGIELRQAGGRLEPGDPIRLPVRRTARASWFLQHVRLCEAPAVWAELERACRALAFRVR